MACSRCGAPLEFANGVPATCRFCGSVERPPEPPRESFAGHAGSAPRFIVIEAPGGDDEAESLPSYAAPEPPPYAPSAGGSVVGKIVMIAAIVLGAAVVLSIVASSGSSEHPSPSHPHHHRR